MSARSIHGASPASFFNNGGGQINPNTGDYYVGNIKTLNWWQGAAGPVTIGSSGANNGLTATAAWNATGTGGLAYFNPSTGEVANPAPADLTSITRIVFASNVYNSPAGIGGTPWYQGQRWDLQWCGNSVPSIGGGSSLGSGSTGMTIDSSSVAGCPGSVGGTAHYIFGTNPDNVYVQFTVPSTTAPPNSIFLFQHQYASNIATCLAAPTTKRNCLNPDWLALDGSFGVMRFMPDFSTNDSAISNFSQLADYSYTSLFRNNNYAIVPGTYSTNIPAAGASADYGPKGGLAPSVVCDIVNQTGSHPHINIPLAANNSFAPLYATGLSGCLKPGLIPRNEYCNEIWDFTGGFNCFYYANYQPWPPLGPSSPYQQAITITAITPSASPTTITAPSHGFTPGQNVCPNVTGTMGSAINFTLTVASVPDANHFTINIATTGLTFSAGTVYTCGTNVQWGAYRAAQIMQQIRTTLGTDSGNGWRGVLGGQLANTGIFANQLVGINFFLANEAPAGTRVNQLFSEVDIAPYWGNGTVDGNTISNITISATPTISFSCNAGAQVCPTSGSKIRIYALSGMTQINNMTATITCSPCTSTGTLNISTLGFSAWNTASGGANTGNFFIDNTLPKMADDSIALNGSAPATYPTKYSYFSQEMADSVVNGTATNSGYVTDTTLSLTAAGIPSQFKTWALQANSYGLDIRQYEGGNGFAYYNNFSSVCYIGCNTPGTFYDFLLNWHYDAGTATFGPQSIYTAAYNAYQAVNGVFPSQFIDTGAGPAPFNGTRFYPGDSTNANWSPVVAKNALGPYVDPTAATSASCSIVASGGLSSASPTTSTSFSANIGATTSPFVVISISQFGGTFGTPVVTVGAVPLTKSVSFDNGGVVSSLYTGIATGLSGSQTVSVTYDAGSGFRDRPVFVFTTANLNSKSILSQTSGNSSGVSLNYTKNGCLIAAGFGHNDWSGTSGSATLASGTPGVSPNPTTYATGTVNNGDAMVGKSNFSSSIFSIVDGGSGGSISVIEVR